MCRLDSSEHDRQNCRCRKPRQYVAEYRWSGTIEAVTREEAIEYAANRMVRDLGGEWKIKLIKQPKPKHRQTVAERFYAANYYQWKRWYRVVSNRLSRYFGR